MANNPVRVFKGKNLQAVSVACKVYQSGNSVRMEFCDQNMTVVLPLEVAEQVAYAARSFRRAAQSGHLK